MVAALLGSADPTAAMEEGLDEMELSDASDGDVDIDHETTPPSHRSSFAGGDSDVQERGYVVIETKDSRSPPPRWSSLPPDCTTQELVARVNAMAAKVDALTDAFGAFVISRNAEDRTTSVRLRRLEDAVRLRSACVLINQVTAAQVDTIKRVFEIEVIVCERQDTDDLDFDPGSPENAPYAWLAGVPTHDPIQVEGYMQYLRARLAPCLDAFDLKLVDVRGRDDLLTVPPKRWSEFQLSGSAHLAMVKSYAQWPVDLIKVVMLINVFAPGEQDFSNGDGDDNGEKQRQWIDDLAVTQLFAADALRPTCLVYVLNTDLVAGWRFYWMTPDSHGVKKRIVRQPKQALELLEKNIRLWDE